RERAIECILGFTEGDPVVSTTGKASRELFELREKRNEGHGRDFLTVGSMGHASSIAFGVAANLPQRTVWCIDGDGAALMHMGAMAVIGAHSPNNLKHIVINNGAHETVGGMPTVAEEVDLPAVAKNCNYGYVASVRTEEELCGALRTAKENGVLSLIEIRCSLGARGDLGRPTTTAVENKQAFMEYLKRFA
ncbi:MAG: phosphonopyruvate decarboxylase, partial [Clostridia bacterium]|nr:phosphonopyruvate decarboxylase [Clostridia bacterium]